MNADVPPPGFRDALHWSELGIACFIAAAILIFLFSPASAGVSLDPLSLALRSTFSAAPFLLTWVTYEKLVKPLRAGRLPRNVRKWSMLLTPMGIFGCVVGIYVLAHADEKIKALVRTV